MSNTGFKPSEGKREEFRKYLEKHGVMDALTKVLVNLYEEADKPEDALEYIRDKLAVQAGIETYNEMSMKLEEQQAKINQLEEEITLLKAATEEEPPGGEGEQVEGDGAPAGEPVPEGDTINADEPKPEEPAEQ